MNLVEVNRLGNLEQYEGELKAFFGFLKYRKKKKALDDFITKHQKEFEQLPVETVQAIAVMGNVKDMGKYLLKSDEGSERRETVNMCQAWEEIKEDCRQEGGIYTLIRDNLDEGISAERIMVKLKKYFSLTEEQSLEYIRQYGD